MANLLRSASSTTPLLPPTPEELEDYELSITKDKEIELKQKEAFFASNLPQNTPKYEDDDDNNIEYIYSENSLFDMTKLRESAHLGEKPSFDLLRASDLRASQLRASQITQKITSTTEFISQTSLTHSQQSKMQLYLGDLQLMRQRIVQLLQSDDDGDDEDLNVSLLSLLDKIDQCVEANQITLCFPPSFDSSLLNCQNEGGNEREEEREGWNGDGGDVDCNNAVTVSQLQMMFDDHFEPDDVIVNTNYNNNNNDNSNYNNNNNEEKKEEEELAPNLKMRFSVDQNKNTTWFIPPPNLFSHSSPYISNDHSYQLESWDLTETSATSFCNSLIGRYVWTVRDVPPSKSKVDVLIDKGFTILPLSKFIYFEVTISDYTSPHLAGQIDNDGDNTNSNENINININNDNDDNNNNKIKMKTNKERINEELDLITIGLGSPFTTPTGTMVGYNIYSYSVSQLGNVHDANILGDPEFGGFGIGDTIGFGLWVDDDELFITKNGKFLQTLSTCTNLKLHNEHCFTAVISIRFKDIDHFSPSLRLSCNFGQIPFAYSLAGEWGTEECAICYMENSKSRMYSDCPNCEYFYCIPCMRQYLLEKINTGKVLSVPCTGCGTEIEEKSIAALLPPAQFAKFQQFRFLALLRLEPNCRWCPKRTCNFGTVGNEKDAEFPILTCPECFTRYCFHCNQKWHEGVTCEMNRKKLEMREATRNQRQEKKNKKWLKENRWVKCKRCGQGIQKTDGCNHMKCVCGFEFCWICGDTIINPRDSSFPTHYLIGACAGLQTSSREELGPLRNTARVGLMAGMIGVGGLIALGLAVPVVAASIVAVPVYGGYRLRKHIKKKKQLKLDRN